MADTACVVCGEPWDVQHINHDMPLWKNLLFRAGKGCECCEGVPPNGGVDVDKVARRLMLGGDDVDSTPALDQLAEKPHDFSGLWIEPPPRVLATCEGCGAEAKLSENEIYPYKKDGKQIGHVVIWTDGPGPITASNKRHDVPLDELEVGHGGRFTLEHIDPDWDFSIRLDKTLCADCWTTCDNCNEVIFDGDARDSFCGDTYDAGNSAYVSELSQTICIDCLERSQQCEGCGDVFFPEKVEPGKVSPNRYGKSDLKDGRCEHCQPPEPEPEEPEEDGTYTEDEIQTYGRPPGNEMD